MEALRLKIINWFLELPEVKKIVYTRLFKQATEDVLASINDDSDRKAKVLAEEMLIELLSPIDPKLIVTYDEVKRILKVGGEPVPEGRLANLKAEAEFVLNSDIWKLIHEHPKELAQRALFIEGDDARTMQKGRTMLFTLKTQKKIVELFAALIHK